MASEAVDWSEGGLTRLSWDGRELRVYENDGRGWQFHNSYPVELS